MNLAAAPHNIPQVVEEFLQ